MANLKEIRTRIGSVSSTKQITSAMKAVSASKLSRSQGAIAAMKPYSNKLKKIISTISLEEFEGELPNLLSKKIHEKKILIVGISSNRGLCGAFNNNIIKAIKSTSDNYIKENKEVFYLSIGKKVAKKFQDHPNAINSDELNSLIDPIWQDPTYGNISKIGAQLINFFTIGNFDKIEIIYNSFKSSARQIVTKECLLPISSENKEQKSTTEYFFEPKKETLLIKLLPKAIKTILFKTVLESIASEHAARMTSMHNATENAKEFLKKLNLEYNKLRQAAITNEILEIVSGANALKS